MRVIKSMTGYGRAQGHFPGGTLTVEVRSVNNRYLDCGVKLPRVYGFVEDSIKTCVKGHISRGKVDVLCSVSAGEAEHVKITLNRPVLEGYLAAMRQMAADYSLPNDVTVGRLSAMNDVFLVEKQEEDAEETKAAVLRIVEEALAAFDAMRQAEGEALAGDLIKKASHMLTLVSQVEARSPETVAAYRQKLTDKLREVLEGRQLDETRIIQEAAIYADKVAVDEETVRLRSHMGQMESVLASGGVVGRKLDFLMQEMNREANTIGSKCCDVALSQIVVEMKSELEKMREQIQNVE